jgi:hypothetical protein
MTADTGPSRPRLTLTDPEGTASIKYYQCCGIGCSPGETGWVVSIERRGEPPVIKPIEVLEVLEDLEMNVPDEEVRAGMILVLRQGTEAMIEALEAGKVAEPWRDGEMTAEGRLGQLREELARLPEAPTLG